MKNTNLPIGLRKPDKGRHSEKNTQHKAGWYQIMYPDGKGGPKFQVQFKTKCVLAGDSWPK